MYRFLLRPKWILFHLLIAGLVVVMVNLGFWQLRRLDERRQFNAAVSERIDAEPVPLDELVRPGVEPADVEWRPVTAAGEYLSGEDVRIVNRSEGGMAGDLIVTPLRLTDGRLLLVERGFVPVEAPAPAPPGGTVTVTGRLRPSQHRGTGGLSDRAEGDLTLAQRVDLERLAPQLPGELVPMWIELERSDPPEASDTPGAMLPVTRPELTERNHLSYAFQWFIFSIAAVVGWFLAVRRSAAATRRSPLSSEAERTASSVQNEEDGEITGVPGPPSA